MTTTLFPNVTIFGKKLSTSNSNLKPYHSKKIKMWTGDTPPTGYVWCDGNNDTPDLRDKFIYFVHQTTSELLNVGNNSINNFPEHNHNVSNVNVSKSVNSTTNTIRINKLEYKLFNYTGSPNPSGGSKKPNNAEQNSVVRNHRHNVNNTNSVGATYYKNEINFSNFQINNGIDLSKPSINSVDLTTRSTPNKQEYVPKFIYIGFIMKSS